MSHVIDIEDRKLLWQNIVADRSPLRRARIAGLGVMVLSEVGGAVDLHNSHDHVFQRSFLLLDAHDLLEGLLDVYVKLESPDATERLLAEDFVAIITSRLARIARSGEQDATDAAELFRFWRRGLYSRVDRIPESLTVAETAALFGISVQAVYKWIKTERVTAFRGDDGKQRISVDELRTTRDQERAIDDVRQALRDNLGGRRIHVDESLLAAFEPE